MNVRIIPQPRWRAGAVDVTNVLIAYILHKPPEEPLGLPHDAG